MTTSLVETASKRWVGVEREPTVGGQGQMLSVRCASGCWGPTPSGRNFVHKLSGVLHAGQSLCPARW